jgi:hypothetical protein
MIAEVGSTAVGIEKGPELDSYLKKPSDIDDSAKGDGCGARFRRPELCFRTVCVYRF